MLEALSTLGLLTPYGALLGYLLGSVPFGLLLTQIVGAGDIRDVGSGNVGATNVLRTGRKGIAALTLSLDVAKGFAAVFVATVLWDGDSGIWAAMFAVLGHNFPLWLKFKGGKGVATSLGVLIGVHWPIALLCLATWIIAAVVGRISSLAALLSFAALPLYAAWFGGTKIVALALALAILGIIRHHANLRRLLRGEESKIALRS